MSEWKECQLEDVALFQRGHDLPKKDMKKGIIPVAGSNGIIGYHNADTTKGPGITIGRSGNIGTPKFYQDNFWAHNTVLYVKDFKGNDEKFVFYFLHIFDFSGFNAGSAVPTLNRNHIHEIPVVIPPFLEQRSIACVLSSLDDKIDLSHRQNKTLDDMAEALWRKMFVEEAHETWEMAAVKDLINILPGFAFKSSDFVDDGRYRLITIKSVQDGYLDLSRTDYIDVIPERTPDYCLLQSGDILLSLTGNVGRCCLVNEENLLLNQRVAKLQARNIRDWAFTYIMFRQASMRSVLEELAKGTAQANLSPLETANYEIQNPPDDLLEKYSEEATPLIEKILNNFNQIRALSRLRDTLIPKLMSGQVRVRI